MGASKVLSGTQKTTGATVTLSTEDIISVSQEFGSSDVKVQYVDNKSLNGQYVLENKDVDDCTYADGNIVYLVPVVTSDVATVLTGTATAGGASTITLTGGSTVNDTYNGMYVYIIDGTGIGQLQKVSDYVGSTKVATMENAWTIQPDNTSVFIVAQFANIMNVKKIGIMDVTNGVFLYDNNGAAFEKITLNSDVTPSIFFDMVASNLSA